MTDAPTESGGDPTMVNELSELEAMASQPSATEERQAEQQQEGTERNEERAAFYCKQIHPFVAAFGQRMKRPLVAAEEMALTRALADVGVHVIPEHSAGPMNPFAQLLLVSLGIAAPRLFAEWNERRQAAKNGEGEPAAPSPAPTKAAASTGDPMLDAARNFDAENKPH